MLLCPDIFGIDGHHPVRSPQANIPCVADGVDGESLVGRHALLAIGRREAQLIPGTDFNRFAFKQLHITGNKLFWRVQSDFALVVPDRDRIAVAVYSQHILIAVPTLHHHT